MSDRLTAAAFEIVRPAYGSGSLADLLPSVSALLGVPGTADVLGLGPDLDGVERIAVLLVDGLGAYQLPLVRPHAPILARADRPAPLTSGFPSTTPVSLVTVGTGALPGAHGILGFTLRAPDGRILNHIHWGDDPDPTSGSRCRPRSTAAAAAGVAVTAVTRPEFEGSGLTVAANRGAAFAGASDVAELSSRMLAALSAGTGPALVYGYHPDLDRCGHEDGVGSPSWTAAAGGRRQAGRPAGRRPAAGRGVAGHRRPRPDQHARPAAASTWPPTPGLSDGVVAVAGEPRVRYLYAADGAPRRRGRRVAGRCSAPSAWVLTREEAIDGGWFGPVPPAHAGRIGDVVVVCLDAYGGAGRPGREPAAVARLVAYHGSVTAAEMTVPLLIAGRLRPARRDAAGAAEMSGGAASLACVGRSQAIGRGRDPRFGPEADDAGCTILHVDMDAFFASVEIRRRPELRGRPVVVGGVGPRGVVSSASYEARRYGVRSAMPAMRARALCPQAVFLPPDFTEYSAASRAVMTIFRDVTPLVEPLSLDEAFLDVAGAQRLLGRPAVIARDIRARVVAEQRLTCSVGVAPSKFVAKLGSTRAKPDGMIVVPAGQVLDFLHPLPVDALWGVGEQGRRDAAPARPEHGRRPGPGAGGHAARRRWARRPPPTCTSSSWGRDPRRVVSEHVEKSIGAEMTFDTDVADPMPSCAAALLALAEKVGARLRAGGQVGRTVAIKVRLADFKTVNRSRTMPTTTDVAREIFEVSWALFEALRAGRPDPTDRRTGRGPGRGRDRIAAAHAGRAGTRLARGGGRGGRRRCPFRPICRRSGQSFGPK